MENIKLKAHEGFYLRDGWLRKGLDFINSNPFAFYSDTTIRDLGVGSNMVKSIKFWLSSTGMVDVKNENGKRGYYASNLANVISKYDKYLEKDFTLEILHIEMLHNDDCNYVWKYYYNNFDQNIFSKEMLFEECKKHLNSKNITYSEKTLADEISVLLRTYSSPNKNLNPEENYVCPFSQLNLISDENKVWKKTSPDINNLKSLAVYYSILKILNGKKEINMNNLISQNYSPVKIFNMTKESLLYYINKLASYDLITFNSTANLDMIYINEEKTLEEIFETYFSKGGNYEL